METKFCQSCGMPIEAPEMYGTEADGSKSPDYCQYCYGEGKFMKDESLEEMIATCVPLMTEGGQFTAEQAHAMLSEQLPTLKRWKVN